MSSGQAAFEEVEHCKSKHYFLSVRYWLLLRAADSDRLLAPRLVHFQLTGVPIKRKHVILHKLFAVDVARDSLAARFVRAAAVSKEATTAVRAISVEGCIGRLERPLCDGICNIDH